MKVFGKHAASTALLLSLTVLLFCIVCGDETSMQDVEEEQFEHSSDQVGFSVLVLLRDAFRGSAMRHICNGYESEINCGQIDIIS